MTRTLITLFVFLSCTFVFAQSSDTLGRANTILKLENPYGKSKTKWLRKQGFPVDTYSWNQSDINYNLDKALKLRSHSDWTGGTGGFLIVLNLCANAISSFTHSLSEKPDKGEFKSNNTLYFIGGSMVISSVILGGKARSKVE